MPFETIKLYGVEYTVMIIGTTRLIDGLPQDEFIKKLRAERHYKKYGKQLVMKF